MKNFIKNHKWETAVSSVIFLIPVLAGILLWEPLQNVTGTQWGSTGGTVFTVIILPLILLAAHWLCLFFTFRDPKNRSQSRKVLSLLFWLLPVLSLFIFGILYSGLLGRDFHPAGLIFSLIGVMFILVGNYLPKITRSSTVGIKVKWALANDENWHKTHRFAGKLWIIGGFVMLSILFLPEKFGLFVFLAALFILVLCPYIYSYLCFRKQMKNGTYTVDPTDSGSACRKASRRSYILLAIILIAAAILFFTGNIEVLPEEELFRVKASYFTDLSVPYEKIVSIEYREESDHGSRMGGFGSPRLLMGTFRNDEFGTYTLYTYTFTDACIVMRSETSVLVLGGRNDEDTLRIYELLRDKIENR